MVTIYVESRTVRVRMPVLSLGRWSGALFVRIQHRCEDHLDQLTSARALRLARSAERARRHELALRRVETHEREVFSALQGRGI